MLVLSRHEGEAICFPELDMAVKIVKIHSHRVQVGVTAPSDSQILRSELVNPLQQGMPSIASLDAIGGIHDRLRAARIALEMAEKYLRSGEVARAEIAMKQAAAQLQTGAKTDPSKPPTASLLSDYVSESQVSYAVTKKPQSVSLNQTQNILPSRKNTRAGAIQAAHHEPQLEGLAC